MEDGSVYIMKNGHINNEIRLSSKTQINQECNTNRFLLSTNSTYEYIECDNNDIADTWVSILRRIRKMVMDDENQMRKSSRKSKGNGSRSSASSRGGSEKTLEA